MCGRYYVDDETAKEIQRLVRTLSENRNQTSDHPSVPRCGDVHPTDQAQVLASYGHQPVLARMDWGFPGFGSRNQVLFNARSESASQKPTFADSMKKRRCIIPARRFYEWDSGKNQISFARKDRKIFCLAGAWKIFEDVPRFVILTTQANSVMKPIHDRMPVILEQEEARTWLYDDEGYEKLLGRDRDSFDIWEGGVQQSFFL